MATDVLFTASPPQPDRSDRRLREEHLQSVWARPRHSSKTGHRRPSPNVGRRHRHLRKPSLASRAPCPSRRALGTTTFTSTLAGPRAAWQPTGKTWSASSEARSDRAIATRTACLGAEPLTTRSQAACRWDLFSGPGTITDDMLRYASYAGVAHGSDEQKIVSARVWGLFLICPGADACSLPLEPRSIERTASTVRDPICIERQQQRQISRPRAAIPSSPALQSWTQSSSRR